MGQPGVYLTDRQRETILKLRSNGVTLKDIAHRELVSLTTVKRILKTNVDKIPQSRVR